MEGVETRVGRISLDGSEQSGILHQPELIVGRIHASDNGKLALTASTPRHPNELFVIESGESEPRRLTRSNDWLDAVDMARQSVFEYQAEDGLELQGLLVWPLDYREGQRLSADSGRPRWTGGHITPTAG